METLTELGRYQICKAIGIKNPNSIFVKSKEAFIDRMNLYRLTHSVDKLVNAYKEELANHDSEEDFISKLNKDTELLYDSVKRDIIKVETADLIFGDSKLLKALAATSEYNVYLRDDENECTLRLYFESPVFEAFKFIVHCFYEYTTFNEYVYSITNNKFLAATRDLDLDELNDNLYVSTLKAQMNLISNILIDIACPKYINSKNIKNMGNAEVQVSSTVHKTVESLDKLVTALRTADGCTFENVCVELFTTKALAKNNTITLKKLIFPNESNSKLNVMNFDEYTFIKYMRKIRKEHNSKYDNILANGYSEMKVTQENKIDWL